MIRPNEQLPLRAFTLIEMVLSLVIVGVILLGLQSAMVLASRSAPERTSGNSAAMRTARGVDQLSADLTYATSITTSTANTIEFIVPDRNGDGSPETIRYSWSGISGDPLLRTVNNGTAATITSNVSEFQLTYDKKSLQRATTCTESGEVLLNSYDGVGMFNLGVFTVDANNSCGQYFKPTLPNGATSWRVTRVKFKAAKNSGNTGLARVQIRASGPSGPGTILDEGTLYESNLISSFAWQEFTFTRVSGRTPGTGLDLIIQWSSDDQACDIQYQLLLATDANGTFVTTSNGGSTWSLPPGQDMLYYVYGMYSTPNPVAYDYWLTGVRCTLRSGSDPAGRVQTTIRVLNEPQVSGP